MTSKKLTDHIYSAGLWCSYGAPEDDYTASAYWSPPDYSLDEQFCIAYHKGAMPAFDAQCYDTLDELEAAMRQIQPDLRFWRWSAS